MHIAFFRLFLFLSFCFICYGNSTTPPGEVKALQYIAKSLGKDDWDFTVDPCKREKGWFDTEQVKDAESYVSCNCSFMNNTVCHVEKITLKSQSLSGTLPTNLSGLPYLTEFDVSRNFLSGTIPSDWGTTRLVNISFIGNRLTGPIPKSFGNIITLANFTLEINELSGELPEELGSLTRLEKLTLSSNNFSGSLPSSFAKLSSLTDFRISDNNFTGSIPSIIAQWQNLKRLHIQGSGFSGPIPTNISNLINLQDLRISDLKNGSDSSFPSLSEMKLLKILVLRNCSISDKLPPYLGNLLITKIIDLSFNKLTGAIPEAYDSLKETQYVYFTGNMLSGKIPTSLASKRALDLSYNNFTYVNACQKESDKANYFSASSVGNKSSVQPCNSCKKDYYGFHINCGGKEIRVKGQDYDADIDSLRPSSFRQSASNWALSNTGNFLDNDQISETFETWNRTAVSPDAFPLHQDARVSPLSMTYVGFCLKNGNYTVLLHFAETRFSNNESYSSLGRSVFNVFIQEKLVLDEFNLVKEAGGVGKVLVKKFTAEVVEKNLEIRFYWAGKGTSTLPIKGVYGPIISAISVRHDFHLPGKNRGILIGSSVAATAVMVTFLLVILWWKSKDEADEDLQRLGQQGSLFSLKQIMAATNNLDPANKIGEGGFGSVYKGVLPDGSLVAVKKLSSKSDQGNREFVTELGMISALQHPHLVKLYGCCVEDAQLLLVYEYMENNSLSRALYGHEEQRLHLDWPTRRRICVDIARGLAFLHEESTLKIVHRDIKSSNVLLDKDLNAKISDFGLAKLDDQEHPFIKTRIAGTPGYMAPEYATRGHLTDKADVYSFGIVALEIVSGKSNSSYCSKFESVFLLDVAIALKAEGKLLELVDPRIGVECDPDEVTSMINIAFLCSNPTAAERPTMSSVVGMLESKLPVPEVDLESFEIAKAHKSIMKQHDDLLSGDYETENQTLSMAMDHEIGETFATSATNLYPFSKNTNDYSGSI